MFLFVIDHSYHYETENLCRVFFPNEEIKVLRELPSQLPEFCAVTKASLNNGERVLSAEVHYNSSVVTELGKVSETAKEFDGECEYTLALCLFNALKKLTGYVPEWGLLTGVRPSKLMNTLIHSKGEAAAKAEFMQRLLVSREKTELAMKVAAAEKRIIEDSKPDDFSLYVSIPFCPSRCTYCSFVSHSITASNAKKLLEPYLDRLCEELEITAKTASDIGLRLKSIYFGGGTPSILSAEQLSRLISKISDCFDLSHLAEYTVEAGRPDTVTKEKLNALFEGGIGRVSINPQTFDDSILNAIGRKHSSAQTLEAYAAARNSGIKTINMDLIAGLPGDTPEGFKSSLNTAVSLEPENITVHSLALKRASELSLAGTEIEQGNAAKEMLRLSGEILSAAGYIPYYMYRQSKCVGNLENVGWCKPGTECLYNVYMMEEVHTVLSVGAGAVTKLKDPSSSYLERIFNFKYPYEYVSRFPEMLSRKSRITEFYKTYKLQPT